MPQRKTDFRRLERFFKGAASHRRLEILHLLKRRPELSVEDIADMLRIGYPNAAEHIRKLAIAGLVAKRHEGASVRHKLTARGESVLAFCRALS